MSILVGNKVNTDQFGNILNQYTGNAGDPTSFEFIVSENIEFTSYDAATATSSAVLRAQNKVVMPSYWHLNGFYVGQNVTLTCTTAAGAPEVVVTTIISIDYSTLVIEFGAFFAQNKCKVDIYDATTQLNVLCTDLRGELSFYFNFTQGLNSLYGDSASITENGYLNIVNPYRSSQIDGTQIYFTGDFTGVGVASTVTMTQQGKRSGAFDVSLTVLRIADLGGFHRYTFTLDFVNVGCLFDTALLFNHSGLYFDLEWYGTPDKTDPTVRQWNFLPANSGWFGEAYFDEEPNSTLTQAVTDDVYYDSATTHTVIIDSASTDISVNACYDSQDDSYYKDNYISQNSNAMLLNSGGLFVGTFTSDANPDGAIFEIEVLSHVFALNVHTVEFTFDSNNQQFIDFVDGLNGLNRVFNIWFTVGNTNHLVFSSDLLETPNATNTLSSLEPSAATEFAEYKTDSTSKTYGAEGSIGNGGALVSLADNLKLVVHSALPKFVRYENITFEVVAALLLDNSDYFVLESQSIDLTQQVYDSVTGITQINVSAARATGLPSASSFGATTVVRFSPYPDELTRFQVTMSFPFLVNWAYWIEQANAPAEFYPNQNRNYINYDDGTYGIFARVFLVADNKNYEHFAPIEKIHDFNELFPLDAFNEEWQGTNSIEYFDQSGNPQAILLENTLMTVKVTVNTIQPINVNPALLWGQMTIEPTAATPRFTSSSNYVNDTTQNYPFIAMPTFDKLKVVRVGATQATFETQIDTNLLNEGNVNLCLKFMNIAATVEQCRFEYPTEIKPPPAIVFDVADECCDKFRVWADTTDTAKNKNNVTSAWYTILGTGDSVAFQLYDSNGVLTAYQPPASSILIWNPITQVFTDNDKYTFFPWLDVLNAEGIGCYELRVKYTDSFAVETTTVWGTYDLVEWSVFNSKGYVGFCSLFNSNQIIDNINFTAVPISDSINVKGFFGNRTPKTEISNIIKSDRVIEKVTEENINEYSFTSDPVTANFSKKLLDLHFLSANRVLVTDYNAWNHNSYVDKEVVIREVLTPDYFTASNKSVVKATFGDRKLNQRSAYGN